MEVVILIYLCKERSVEPSMLFLFQLDKITPYPNTDTFGNGSNLSMTTVVSDHDRVHFLKAMFSPILK